MFHNILEEISSKNKRLTAKFMTAVEKNDPQAIKELKSFYLIDKVKSHVIGITGLPGAGKSSLISKLINYYRNKELIVGVIVIDPSSPFSGGAFLGDRVRMTDFFMDDKVFIRSMASKGKLGGVAPATAKFIEILATYGCDVIIVETTGTGQSEIEINQIVDTVIVVTIPGTGDLVQSMKAGILEIANIFVINKADMEGKDNVRLVLEQLIDLEVNKNNDSWTPLLVETIAIKNDLNRSGINNLANAIARHTKYNEQLLKDQKFLKEKKKKEFTTILEDTLHQRMHEIITLPEFENHIERLVKKEIDPLTLAELIINELNVN